MLTDAELSMAVGCDTKWLYNASRRLKRPLHRTVVDTVWWRLTHHFAAEVGIPLANAAIAANTMISLGPEAGRVRLGATRDQSVAITVELPRFHDTATLAIAAALHLAVPRPRGRPRKRSAPKATAPTRLPESPLEDRPERLHRALDSAHAASDAPDAAHRVLQLLIDAGVTVVIVGEIAAVYHGLAAEWECIDLVADATERTTRELATVLDRLDARPRGVPVRDGFGFDAGSIRSVECLALRVSGVSVNISWSLSAAGEYQQLRDAAEVVELGGRAYALLSVSDIRKAPR